MARALIAGAGALPKRVFAAWGDETLLCELEGAPSGLPGKILRFRIEQLGSFLATLRDHAITEVCFAGHLRRPPLDPALVDAATMPLVPRMLEALGQGDDAALRTVLSFFEEAGIAVRAAQEIAPDLMPPAGVLSRVQPGERDVTDAARAHEIHVVLGTADIGQACAVAAGQALAVETLGGTDWMLATLSGGNRPSGPPGGVLYKAAKPGQDMRIDVPAIGPDTVIAAKAAGLSGIVIAEGGVIVLGRDATIAAADAARLFLWVRRP
ncbi:MAG: UDP-2,3-diacylglucosamine diphosphatase LpxI [Pseudomonadota bacterium]